MSFCGTMKFQHILELNKVKMSHDVLSVLITHEWQGDVQYFNGFYERRPFRNLALSLSFQKLTASSGNGQGLEEVRELYENFVSSATLAGDMSIQRSANNI